MQLYPALFDRAENHMRIVRALANTRQGVSKEQADEFRLKTAIFKSVTKTNKQVFFTLLTTFPIVPNEQSLSAVDIALDMNCLFEPF